MGGGGETKVQYESIKLFITLKVKSQVKPNLFCAEIRLHLTSSHNDCSRMFFVNVFCIPYRPDVEQVPCENRVAFL